MSFVHRLFSCKSSVKTLSISETPVPLSFLLSSFRWHLDSRPPKKAILLHDFMSSSLWWQQLLNEGLSKMPVSGMTPKNPLELYAVDLRGHNHSMQYTCPSDANQYALACAADIVHHQREIIRDDAMLVGAGFGALLACLSALHSPESGIESLTLLVNDLSQLMTCDPSQYTVRSIIAGVPKDIKSLSELNQYLKKQVPNPVERSLILSTAEKKDDVMKFRINNNLLGFNDILRVTDDISGDVIFNKRVTVIQCSDTAPSADVKNRFMQHFPQATFVHFDEVHTLGIGSLCAQSKGVPETILKAMDMLGEMGEAPLD